MGAGLHGLQRGGVALAVVTALVATTPVQARAAEAVIAVDTAASGCPARADVTSALESRLPGVTRGAGAQPGAARYRLEVSRAPGSLEAPLRLKEASGQVVLERRLSVESHARPQAPPTELCRALAEAAAVVVVRYLQELGYRPSPQAPPQDDPAPPILPAPSPSSSSSSSTPPLPSAPEADVATTTTRSPPPTAPTAATTPATATTLTTPPSIYLGLAAATRAGLGPTATTTSTSDRMRTELALSLQFTAPWWHAELAGGIASATTISIPAASPPGQLRLRAFPARAAAGIPVPLLGGTLLPTAGINLDLLSFQTTALPDARSGTVVEPAAELTLGYRRAGSRLFLRVLLAGGLTLGARDFDAGGAQPVFRTPAAYLRGQVELGLALWKN